MAGHGDHGSWRPLPFAGWPTLASPRKGHDAAKS